MIHPSDIEAIEDIYPLSPMQQGMLFHTLSAPESGIYMLQTSYTLRGRLDVPAFQRAWTRVVERHPILRTVLVWEGLDEPVQVVLREVELLWTLHDWRAMPPDEQRDRLETLLREDRAAGFDLSAAPLMRLTLVQLDERSYSFVWSRHHLLLDGWSIAVVLRELFAYYEAFKQGRDLHLARPQPYREYIAWLQRQDLAGSERFWRELLRGFTAPTVLPIDRAPGRVFTGEGSFAEHTVGLSPRATAAVESWVRSYQITVSTLLQGAWALLLSRYSGAEDVVFGATVFGRPTDLTGVEAMVGLFVNALPVRARVAPARPVLPWLRDLQAQQAAAREHEHTPLAQIQGWSEVPRGVPLFESDVVFENYPIDDGLRRMAGELEVAGGFTYDRTNYPLTLFGVPGPELLLRIAYDSSRFDAPAVARLTRHVRALLEGIIASQARRLADLPLLTTEERQQVLIEWNATGDRGQGTGDRSEEPDSWCVHHLIELQVAWTPDAIAVVFDETKDEGRRTKDESSPFIVHRSSFIVQMTYRDLDARANQLAHHLRRMGVGPDVRVGVCMERSVELVVAIMGVLKAGGAYVPLDPAYPAERITFMLEDSGAKVVLTMDRGSETRRPGDKEMDALLVSWSPGLLVSRLVADLRADWPVIARMPVDGPDVAVDLANLAYVIYTSGSTGAPKGVMVTHRGVVNYLSWCTRAYDVAAGRGAPVHSPIGFDLTVTSLFAPLLAGSRVELLPESIAGEALGAALADADDFSLVKITPAHLDALGQRMPPGWAAGRTRAFVIGGEALRGESLAFWRTHAPAMRLINEYGPTETVVGCCAYEVPAGPAPASAIPIGRPIANTEIYLLDRAMQPVPIGVPGELYVGGDGVARGYLGRPELTAERFMPNPFAEVSGIGYRVSQDKAPDTRHPTPGTRLYRTGDLARYREDGNLVYLGRLDQQVKIRGYRVELGEVEAALIGHPAVRETLVVATAPGEDGGTGGARQLVAYVVPTNDQRPTTNDQRRPTIDDGMHSAEGEHVAEWRQVFEDEVDSFSPRQAGLEPTFNTAGWNSSYTGRPLPAEQMREWVDQTVARIAALRPQRVLEIGCGTGLLLFRIAPGCECYIGTDFAEAALAYVRAQLAALALPQVRLLRRTADDLSDLEPESFDLVVLNSVVQYFPSLEYLLRVLEGATRLVAPGGHLFVGDVRSQPLLEAFHTSVELARAPDDLTTARLRQRLQRRVQQEAELVIDPALFAALGQGIPRVGGARVLLRRGRCRNELTCFRYDVIMRVGAPPPDEQAEPDWQDWAAQGLTLERLRQMLAARRPDRLALARVPNARLLDELATLDLLAGADPPATVGALRAALPPRCDAAADPERIWALADELGYAADLCWPSDGRRGDYDVLLWRPGAWAPWVATPEDPCPWSSYANNPLTEKLARALVPELRTHLQARLPSFMVPASFVFLEALPLTPHGKLDPAALPPLPLPELEPNFVAPGTPAEQALAEIWGRVLGLGQAGGQPLVSIHSNFFELGGDSIHSIQVVAQAQQAGLRLTPKQIFLHPTIAELALVAAEVRADQTADEQGPVTGELPLTPIQRWFFEQELPEPWHFNQALLLELRRAPRPARLARVLRALLAHHDALRLRFTRVPDGWRQVCPPVGPAAPLAWLDLSALPEERRRTMIEGCAAVAQAGLDLEHGRLVHALLFDCGPAEPPRLLLVVHHLAIDGVSWHILLEDLATACALANADAALPPKTSSFKRWAERLLAYAVTSNDLQVTSNALAGADRERDSSLVSETLRAELPHWLALGQAPATRLPLDRPIRPGANTEAHARVVQAALSVEETRALLQEVPAAYQTRVDDVLLAALGSVCARWTGARTLLLDLESHGREELFDDLDLSRTIGWFTALYPLRLDVGADDPPGQALKAVKEQLRRIPRGGVGYGVLRYLSDDQEIAGQMRALPQAELRFNYLGQLDQALPAGIELAREASGPPRSPRGPRPYLLEVSASVAGGRLRLAVRYSEQLHERATVERLVAWLVEALRELIDHCVSPAAGGYTPSDFPQADLTQEDLDDLLDKLGEFEG